MPFTIRLHKGFTIAATSICLLSFTKPLIYQKDFTGTWTLNESKSETGEYGTRGLPKKIVITQKDKDVTITKTTNAMGGGETVYTEALTADGKEVESTVSNNGKRKAKLNWEDDGKQFDIHFTIAMSMQGQAVEFHGLEKWTLSDDGKMLFISFDVTTPQGSFSVKGAYDKN